LTRYAETLREADCRLMFAGVSDQGIDELEKTGVVKAIGRENVFKATDRPGESTLAALGAAEKWIEEAEQAPNGVTENGSDEEGSTPAEEPS
jgi:hypothetical protein